MKAKQEDGRAAVLLTARQVAAQLNISVRTLWRLESSGKLPRPVVVGSSKRWIREELLAWISSGCPSREDWEEGHQPGPGSRM